MKLFDLFSFKKKNKTLWNEYYKSDKVKFEVPKGSIYHLIKDAVPSKEDF